MSVHAGKRPGSGSSIEESVVPSVQRRPGKRTPVEDADAAIHAAARVGTSGPSVSLPFGPTIQRAFGRHDVSHVQAHIGGVAAEGAAAMGAEAFAAGDRVAFAVHPTLHTAAHEAAHVVQQRAGVQLKGGVGQVGDPYERHADAVADRVVAGQSAESLLDQMAGSGSGGGGGGDGAVQRKVGFELEVNWSVKRDARTDDERAKEASDRAAFDKAKQDTHAAAHAAAQEKKTAEYKDLLQLFEASKEYQDFLKKSSEPSGSMTPEPTTGTITESDLRTQFPEFAKTLDERNNGAKKTDRRTMLDVLPVHVRGMLARQKAKRFSIPFRSKQQQRYSIPAPNPEFFQVSADQVLVRNQNDNAALESFLPGINIPKATTLMSGPPSQTQEPSPHGEAEASPVAGRITIAAKPLWDLTADESSGGVSQLEWVTRPLETRAQVAEAMTQMTSMGTQMNTIAKQVPGPIAAEQLERGGVEIVPEFRGAGLKIYPDAGKTLLADPQFTGGFRLDQLATLMELLTSNPQVTTKQDGTGEAKDQSTAPYSGKQTGPEIDALGKALRESRRAQATEKIGGAAPSEELVSLLTMILNYLYIGERRLENPKSIAGGFMSRTDFVHNFGLLPAAEQDHFQKTKGSFAELVGRVSQLDMNGKVYVAGFHPDAAQPDKVIDYPLTRGAWCDGIVGGTDLLRKSVDVDPIDKPFLQDGEGNQQPDPGHFSLGRLGSVNDTVGPDHAKAAVVELRRMTGGLAVEKWLDFGLNAFDLVQTMNAEPKKPT